MPLVPLYIVDIMNAPGRKSFSNCANFPLIRRSRESCAGEALGFIYRARQTPCLAPSWNPVDGHRISIGCRDGQIVVQDAINGVSGNFVGEKLRTVELDHGNPSGVGGAISNVRGVPDLELARGGLFLDKK